MNESCFSNKFSDSKGGYEVRNSNGSNTLAACEIDPLIGAINAMKAGLADYNANAPEDDDAARAYAEISYRPPRRVIERWKRPAISIDGAVSALRLARDADRDDDGLIVTAMLSAALAFFDPAA